MKIVVPLEDNDGLESILSSHFGRSPYYAVVKVFNNRIESIEIVENPKEQGLKPSEYCVKIDAKYVIIKYDSEIGIKALRFLRENRIEVLCVDALTLREAIQKFLKKEYEYYRGEGCRGRLF